MNLIIVESPTKAKTLTRFLGKDYRIASTMGHIRDLPKKRLGIDVEKDFQPEYVLVVKKKEAIQKIKDESKKAKKIFLASVDYEEPILVKYPDGLVYHLKIGKFVDKMLKENRNLSLFEIPAFDPKTQKISFKKLKGVSRHRINQELLEIILDYGRKIKITASHSVFTKDEKGRIKTIAGKNLRVGDKLLVPLSLPLEKREIREIDLLKTIYENKKQGDIPRSIPVNRDLMLFLGFFVAKGNFLEKGKYLRFSFGKKEIGGEAKNIKTIKKISKRLFNLSVGEFEERTSTSIVLKSTLVAFLIKEVFKLRGKASEKEAPWIVFNVPLSLQFAFLEGLFLGDGSLGKDRIVFNTVSPRLAEEIRFLLLANGILNSCSLALSKKPNRKPLYQILVTGKARLAKIRKIWRRHYRAEILESYLKSPSRIKNNWSKVVSPSNNLGLLRIREIRKVKPSSEFVYDLSVEGENFICGNGGVCAHNTDPDREGEAIAWHVEQILNLKSKILNLQRIVFHEVTKEAIEKALAHPRKIDLNLVDAQQARRVLDRLVGYKLSPLLWRKIRRGLSAGRVQSVAVRLIVDREREIEKFVPKEYWEIIAELKRHIGGKRPDVPSFFAKLIKKNGKKIEVENETAAKEIVSELEKAGYEAAEVEKKEVVQNPVPPFTTSTLQQQGAQKLGFSSKRTMQIAQSLYEKGLITYHRTDSVVLASQAVMMIRKYIEKTFGNKYLPEKPRVYKTKSKVAQEAHEAIRPTDVNKEIKHQTKDEERLYDLIWKRAIASQMAAAIWDQTRVLVQAAGKKNIYHLLARGKVIKFDGWLKIYRVKEQESKRAGEVELPELKKGDELDLLKLTSEQKFTQPPPRFTEATLIKALEEKGIGRPSTYAPTVSTIQDRQYVEKMEGRFHPTPLGITVNDFLVDYFPGIVDYDFTAKMEDELDEIANGKRKWVPVIKDFYLPFNRQLEGVTEVAERVQVPTEVTEEECPKCKQGKLVIRIGKFGKFLSCSRFPECDYTAPYIQIVEGVKCPKCGGEVVIRKTRKGKQFYGCSNYPKCNWASRRKPP